MIQKPSNFCIARIYHQIGQIYCDQQNYEEAYRLIEKSLEMSKKLGDQANSAANLCILGSIEGRVGNYDKGLEFLNEGLKIFYKLNDKTETGRVLNEIALIEAKKGNKKKSLNLLSASLKTAIETADEPSMAVVFHSLGQIHEEMGNLPTAALNYSKSLLIFSAQSCSEQFNLVKTKYDRVINKMLI